jgi:hypothetical protein
MEEPIRKYQPSNGTEGMMFCEAFCEKCKHELFMHTQNHGDKMCQIFSDSLIYDIKEAKYPSELTYDMAGNPTCTNHELHDWVQDIRGKWNQPEELEEKDPNQLSLF